MDMRASRLCALVSLFVLGSQVVALEEGPTLELLEFLSDWQGDASEALEVQMFDDERVADSKLDTGVSNEQE